MICTWILKCWNWFINIKLFTWYFLVIIICCLFCMVSFKITMTDPGCHLRFLSIVKVFFLLMCMSNFRLIFRFKKMIIFCIKGKSACHSRFLFCHIIHSADAWLTHNIQKKFLGNLTINWIFDLLFCFCFLSDWKKFPFNVMYQNDHNYL